MVHGTARHEATKNERSLIGYRSDQKLIVIDNEASDESIGEEATTMNARNLIGYQRCRCIVRFNRYGDLPIQHYGMHR
jgi:hypothetical protein